MAKRTKTRKPLEDILASCSETLFPAELGAARVTLDSRSSDGDTPLHDALWRDDTYAVLRFIEAGADVNAQGNMLETPLHIAVRKKNLAVVEALLSAGADVSIMSEFGQSPKSLAEAEGGSLRRLFLNK
ncbi:MAG: ankyrin repeat domain-containing protein [Pseudomonadota bacterium]